MGPAEIQERLEDRFRAAVGGGRSSLPRQQALRAALDWSFMLLSSEERPVFNRLAVFAAVRRFRLSYTEPIDLA
jgi:predicted ATPase